MLKKQEWGKGGETGEHIRLLDEVEAPRKPLAVVKKPSGVRRRSLSVSGTSENRWKSDRSKIDLLPAKKAKNPSSSSSSSIWNWKPLRALSHIHHRKLDCRFTLQIHSIEGIPAFFDHSRLCVHWRCDSDEVGLSTRSAKVSHGTAVFQEILEDRCTVYGSKPNGHSHAAKYQAKNSVLIVAVEGASRLNLGEHRVDLTRFLPLTPEEEEDRSGKWSTAFKLSGLAKGALLNVTIGFSLGDLDDLCDPERNDRKSGLTRAGSLPIPSRDTRGRSFLPPQSVGEIKTVHEIFPASEAAQRYPSRADEFSAEEISEDCSKFTFVALRRVNKSPPVFREDASLQVAKIDLEDEKSDPEFTVIEKGIESAAKDTMEPKENEINRTEAEQKERPVILGHVAEESPPEFHSDSTPELEFEELNDFLQNLSIFDSADWESLESDAKPPEQHAPEEIKRNRGTETADLSLNSDDEAEFLRALELDCGDHYTTCSDGDQESLKARLWKQFREESLADREKNIFDLSTGDNADMNWLDLDYDFDNSGTVISADMDVHLSQAINSRRKAKRLDDAEAEALMRELGLNDLSFQHTPPGSPTGFGSPIELFPEDDDHDDGDHHHDHHRLENSGCKIMQASSPLVMPGKKGTGVMEILQALGSLGVENLAVHARKMMPLEDFPRDSDHADTCSSDKVSLRDLPRSAMEKIEALAVEGLKIQSGTSQLKVLDPELQEEDTIREFLSPDVPIEEWMKLDSGMTVSGRDGDWVTLAFMVQLGDNEPVGAPMLVLVQAEKLSDEICSIDEKGSLLAGGFKIADLHLAGVKSGTPWMSVGASSIELNGSGEVGSDGDYIWSISNPVLDDDYRGGFFRNPNMPIYR